MGNHLKTISILLIVLVILLSFEACTVFGDSEDTPAITEEIPPPIAEPEEDAATTCDTEELELLAHLLGGEAGADWCSDEMIYYVGSVVLNRVESEYFPDTLKDVIFAKGQYACTWDGNFDREPPERCYRVAEDLLLNGSVLPSDVVFQAEFKQGSGVYKKVQNMYFCYL